MDEKKENITLESKSWLQRLKDESWEAELLVSAIAIFGTFKMFDIVDWVTNFFINVLNPGQYFIGYFIVTFGLLAVSILAVMFLIHFFLRAYWIGLVGLNSVFPDYSIEDSAYSKIYTEKILGILPKLKDSISKVDELCSVIFSVAFTFLLIYGYLAIFSSIYLLLYNLLVEYIHEYILLIPLIILILISFFQFIIAIYANLKANKEKEKIQILSFKFTRISNMIMLGPLYKNLLQITMIFGSNFKKRKSLIYLVLIFGLCGIFMFANQLTKTNILYLINNKRYFNSTKTYSSFYKDENSKNKFLLSPEIQSDKIESNLLKVFIPVFNHEEKMRIKFCGKDKDDKEESLDKRREKYSDYILNCFQEYYHIYINNKKVKVDFLRYNAHARTNQSGIVTYIDISHLEKGIITLEVKKEFEDVKIFNWKIPFYKLPEN